MFFILMHKTQYYENNVMKNHDAHTVIYVEDSSICVSSFFPSWL